MNYEKQALIMKEQSWMSNMEGGISRGMGKCKRNFLTPSLGSMEKSLGYRRGF